LERLLKPHRDRTLSYYAYLIGVPTYPAA